jgi:[CysO sulfur-carrier protein]-S-L-cysteine hydrolase
LPNLTIDAVTLDRLVHFAEDTLPFESCALLLGESRQHNTNVLEMLTLKNQDHSGISFSVDPNDLFNAYEHARRIELDIVGIFHSHPSTLGPSRKDKKFMQLNPIIWLIYSTTNHIFSAFVYSGVVMQVQISIIKGEGVRHPWGIIQPP